MIKKTLYFGNPTYLSVKDKQLIIKVAEVEKNGSLPESFKEGMTHRIPIEDIGVVVLDHKQITITQGVLEGLMGNNCALISCDSRHHPYGLMLPLEGHTLQSERYRDQINCSLPLKKQLWQQTVKSKIFNQAAVLKKQTDAEVRNMFEW